MIFFRTLKFLKYFLFSRHGKGHGIQSPFVFNLVSGVFRNKIDPDVVLLIERIRKKLICDKRTIKVLDLGSGSSVIKSDLRKISDIANSSIRFVNRNAGSGTRLWLDKELSNLKIPANEVLGYDNIVKTHNEAAALIMNEKADVAVGLQAAAHQHGLDFVPLFEERYDLVLPRENKKVLMPLLDYLQTSDFRAKLHVLPGYNSTHTGEQIPL